MQWLTPADTIIIESRFICSIIVEILWNFIIKKTFLGGRCLSVCPCLCSDAVLSLLSSDNDVRYCYCICIIIARFCSSKRLVFVRRLEPKVLVSYVSERDELWVSNSTCKTINGIIRIIVLFFKLTISLSYALPSTNDWECIQFSCGVSVEHVYSACFMHCWPPNSIHRYV